MDDHTVVSSKNSKKPNIKKIYIPMVRALDSLLNSASKDDVSQYLAASIANMDVRTLSTLLTQNVETEFGEKLFNHIINEIDDETYEIIAVKVMDLVDTATVKYGESNPARVTSIQQAYQKMINSERGIRLQSQIRKRQEQEKIKKEKHIAELTSGFNRILSGEIEPLMDEDLMHYLPNIITQMFTTDKEKIAKAIIDRIGSRLCSDETEIRDSVFETLLNIIDDLPSEKRIEILNSLQNDITGWVKIEDPSHPGYERICNYLQELADDHIKNKQFYQYNRIMETIQYVQKEKALSKAEPDPLTTGAMETISTVDVLSVLLEEFQSSEGEKREQVIPLLIQMGSAAVDPLLNMLKESDSMSLRAKIIQILSEIGPDAISGVTKRINDEEPWFYLRNLSRILGNIGDKDSLEFLTKLLSHEEYLVQQEALNSIYTIGGEKREEVFLSLLSTVDDRLKSDIVGILGALKSEKALSLLLELLETETFIAPEERIILGERICNVLGSHKYKAAVPTLRSIVELKKGFLVKKTYSEKVQLAAEKALEMIQA